MRQSTLKALASCTKSPLSHIDKDFFGIASVTSKDVAGSFKSGSKLPQEEIAEKYEPLMQSRQQLENKEHDVDVTFGRLRVDSDNIVRSHGQFEPTNERRLYETTDIKQKYVPTIGVTSNSIIDNENVEPDPVVVEGVPNYNKPYKLSEVGSVIDLHEALRLFKSPSKPEDLSKYINQPPLTFFFRNYRSSENDMEEEEVTHNRESGEQAIKEKLDFRLSGRPVDSEELESIIVESSDIVDKKPVLEYDPSKDKIPLMDLDPESEEFQTRNLEDFDDFDKFDKSLDEKFDIKKRPETSKKALDYLKEIRSKRIEPTAKGLKHRLQEDQPYSLKPAIKLDSKGFRIFTHQVPNWLGCRRIDILNHIESSIVYHNYEILAINKPYGIASHPDSESKDLNMNSIVQELAKKMRIDKVYLTHRLDKDTTGVLVFATSQNRANYINKLFKADEIKKTYWCLTDGVPEIEHAIIDIPIGKFQVAGKVRSCVVPLGLADEKQLDKKSREAKRAITEYKVLQTKKNATLLAVMPRTGLKHQIRCHLGFGLNTPILGDHKYSHLAKVAPQRLSPSITTALHVRQAKARTLPMHLHAKSIVIPRAKLNGETLFINAPLPPHFIENLKALNLWNPDLL